MKHTNQCPKCGSKDVIADAKAIDRGDANLQQEMSVATFQHPEAFIFKGQQTTTVSAWVCAKCGFIELYADDPGHLRTS